jgi:very-short-patch-repair endonuclease
VGITVSTEHARELRNNSTPFEGILWSRLRLLREKGYHFRRQAPFKGYYLDFVCFNYRLVVELDGAQHLEPPQVKHDAIRGRVLAREGFLTLRFRNAEVMSNVNSVVRRILAALELRGPTRPLRGLPPNKGEGL